MVRSCVNNCYPPQLVNINIALNSISDIELFDDCGNKYDNDCLEYSYSLDGVVWSCFLKYSTILNNLLNIDSDYFIRIKVSGPVGKILQDEALFVDYTTKIFDGFEFASLDNNRNIYNPYTNLDCAMRLNQQLTDTVNAMFGIPIYYFKLSPNINSKDFTFKEYSLMGVESVKQIKLIISDGVMPSSKPEFNDFDLVFQTDWETEIAKTQFATAFGNTAQPMEGDLIYIPMMKRMWMINGAYEEKKDAFMWNATTFKVTLVKYQEKGSVDLGDMSDFIDTLVKNKYDDLFGNDENNIAERETVESPSKAFNPAYPVYESDAERKYVKCTSINPDMTINYINSKLVEYKCYNKASQISNYAYDFTQMNEASYIIYQKQFCGEDGSVSFIFEPIKTTYSGVLLDIAGLTLNIEQTMENTKLSLLGCHINLVPNNKYFVYMRWNKKLNIVELSAAKYTHPDNIPLYKLDSMPQVYKFDFDNQISNTSIYDIEYTVENKRDVVLNSFYGKITNIKVFTAYIDNISELLQQYPTNGNLLINDAVRKFVDVNGVSMR